MSELSQMMGEVREGGREAGSEGGREGLAPGAV
jgi:hypothetical protein